jgi:hypothetical protein
MQKLHLVLPHEFSSATSQPRALPIFFFLIYIRALICRANELCLNGNRKTLSANDILQALEEIDFPEFAEPLGECLEGEHVW